MYNDEFNNNDMYRFTNRDMPRDDYAPAPRQENVPAVPAQSSGFFHRTWVKITALVLACVVAGGAAGYGGAALAKGGSGSGTAISESDRTVTAVKVKKVDGKTKMQPAEVYASTVNSTVSINCSSQSTNIFGQTTQSASSGSGFIISEDGYIVTNYHVIDGARAIKVTFNNGETYDAKLVGGEELNDVAVLKVDGVKNLKPVVLGDSDDLVVGETVCTIGNALGSLSFSQTSGGVSATDRAVTMSDGTVINLIQTDCTINSGNSGGPLFDSYGRVAGITSAKYSNNGDSSSASIEGIGFAIPINDVLDIITDYMQYGYVTGRPYMGVLSPADVTEQYMQAFGWPAGVYVNGVEEGSCAETAGIKRGDIITKLDDTEITGTAQLTSVKNGYRAGDTVTVTVYRGGEYLNLELTFDEQKDTTQSSSFSGSDSQQQGGQNGQQGGNGYYYNPWRYFFGG